MDTAVAPLFDITFAAAILGTPHCYRHVERLKTSSAKRMTKFAVQVVTAKKRAGEAECEPLLSDAPAQHVGYFRIWNCTRKGTMEETGFLGNDCRRM